MTANRLPLLGWLFILGWLSAAAGSANGQLITPAADGTNTVVTPNGNRYDISGGSLSPEQANLFHSFTEFGLSEGQTANFLTNPNVQNILGRITGGNPSLINGLIQVTGGNSNLYLMNPAGMIFGPSSSLNVLGSFNATTATGIGFGNNQWFSAIGNNNWATLIGTPNSFAFTSSQGGSIVNAGNLTVTPGQSLTLVGGTVVNTGQLNAPSGNILISAVPDNNLVRISQAGHLLSLDIQPTATQSSLPNNWTQPVLSLPELLTGKGATQATSLTVNPNGEVVLTGDVAVPVTAGTAIASGTLNVSGGTGGNVNILGEKVGVIAGHINASGINGGGNIVIGGEYQGLGTVPNALWTFVSSDSTINADAVSNGQGGRVIVWADETTRFNGNITARGGLFSGNGGFAEVSGKQSLDFQGLVDLRSTFGIAGTLLLDPNNITISADPDAEDFLSNTINNETLQKQLGVGNVIISTSGLFIPNQGDITVNAPISGTSNSLTLNAHNNIYINNTTITSQGGNITLNADSDNFQGGGIQIVNSTIDTKGGDFVGNGKGSPTLFHGIAISDSIINAGGGNIDLNGVAGNTGSHGISLSGDTLLKTTGSGNITLNGINGGIPNSSGIALRQASISSENGDITLTGSGNGTGEAIYLFSSSVVESTGTGSITITGTGGNQTSGSNEGIILDTSEVRSTNGAVSLTGIGNGSQGGSNGIDIRANSIVESIGGGSITLNGTGGNGTFNNKGISIKSSIVQSAGGSVSLSGTGAGTGSDNIGVSIDTATVQSTAGNGTVTITGIGGNGTDKNPGISIGLDSVVQSTGTGDVTLTGFGGNGVSLNRGIVVTGTVKASFGNVSLTGIGGGAGPVNEGIYIDNGTIQTAELGMVTLTGTGTASGVASPGISVGSGTVRSENGDIALIGTGVGTSSSNGGIHFGGLPITVQATGTGNISLTGEANNNSLPINLTGGVIDATLGSKVTLTGDEIKLSGTTQVNGKGIITLQPLTPSLGILLGGTENIPDVPPLNLIQTELDRFKGFSQMVIGRADGTGAIKVDPAGVLFNSPITATIIQPPTGTGSIEVNGPITGNGSITFNGATSLSAGVSTTDQNITFNGPVTLIKNVLVDTGIAGSGDINFQKTVNGTTANSQDLTLTAGTGNITFSGDVGSVTTPLGNLQINSANNVQTKTITAASIIQNVFATGTVTISGDLTATNGDIYFENRLKLNSVSPETFYFTANKPGTTGLDTGRITLDKGFEAGSNSLTVTADEIDISNLPSSGTGDLVLQPFRPDLKIALGGYSDRPDSLDITLLFNLLDNGFKSIAIGRTDSSGAITIESPLTFKDPLTIRSPQGAGSIAIFPAGALTGVDNASIALTANQNITAGNITTSGSGDITVTSTIGTIALNGPITTLDQNITFNGPVTLQNNVLLDTGAVGGGNILFNSTLNGTTANNQNLTLTAGTGNITFKGDVGNSIAVGNLQINGARDLQLPTITANSITQSAGTGTTAFKGPVTTNASGGLNLTGTNFAIDNPVTTLNNGTFKVNNSGNLNIATVANLVLDGEFTQSGTGKVNIGSNITTTNDNISFNSPVTLTNDLSFKTGAGAGDIIFNNTVDSTTANSPNLTLTAGTGNIIFKTGAIGTSTTPFGAITANSSGTTSFASIINAQSLTTDSGGTTQLNGNVTTIGSQTYGDAVTIANNPILSGSDINFNNTVDGPSDLTVNALSGNVTFNGAVGSLSALGKLTANSTGTTAFNQTVNAASLTTDAGGTTQLNGNVTTIGSQTYGDAVTIANNPILSGSDINFNNTVDGPSDLTVNALSGNVTFNGAVGSLSALGKLTANSTGTTAFNQTVNAASLTTDAGGTTQLKGNVTTIGSQTYGDAVTIANNPILSGSDINFNNTVDGPSDLTVNALSGNVTFNGAVGSLSALGKLTANSTGTTAFNQTVNAASLTTDAGGTTQVKGDVTTIGSQTYGDAVTIANNPILSGSDINFNNTVDGTSDLTVNALSGNVTFNGAVGSLSALGKLTANSTGTTAFNQTVNAASLTTDAGGTTQVKGDVTTIGSQTYGDAVTIANNPILSGSDINFNNTVDGTSDLTVNALSGNVTFNGAVGSLSALGKLTANSTGTTAFNQTVNSASLTTDSGGTTQLNGNVTTIGSQTYGDAVTIANNPILSGSDINFNNTVDGTSDLTVNALSGNVTFNGAIGSLSALGKLTANSTGTTAFNQTVNAASLTTDAGGTTQVKGDVTTIGSQTYGDAVTIANNPILSGSDINFNNTVDGTSDLTVNALSGNVTFNGAVGSLSALGKLTANSTGTTAFNQTVNAASLTTDAGGTTKLNGNVTTIGSQTYGDAVTIANNPILSGSDINFNNTVDGTSDLTVNALSGNVTFNNAIGETTPLTSLTANSKISLGGNVTTTGSQTYADAVTVAKNSVFSGSGITFNNTVDVAGNLAIAADNVNLKGTVTTTNDGTLTITNKVNLNIENNLNLDGAFIQKGGGTVAVSGNITTTNDNISFSDPVTLKAPVTLTAGDATIAFGSSLDAGNNPLTLTAGEIDFSGNVSGTGALTLQAATAGQNIAVGGTDNNTSALDLTASEINLFQNGFSLIAIGRSDSSAQISIPSNLTFLDPVNIQAGTGTIALDGTLTGNDNSSITLNASTINLNSGINTNKNPLAFNGNVQLGNDINLSTGGGDIKIIGALDGNHLLNLDAATGNVLVQGNIGGTAPLSALNVTATQAEFTNGNIASNSGFNIAAANTRLGGNVTTNQGNININGILGLTKDVILSTAGGNIAFGGAIDSIDVARSLNLDAGIGSITFSAPVGATRQLANVAIANAGDVTANSTINAQSLRVQSAGNINLLGNVTASNSGNGGAIELLSPQGKVNAKDLNTAGNIGGNITVKALNSITAGQLNSSATVGNAGNVFLDPIGDIQVEWINAQGGTGGIGGEVFISSTGGFFRATGVFSTPLSPTGFASISTAGAAGGGLITIVHAGGDGGTPIQPFVVGNAASNGTAGAITTGQSIITSQSFPRSSSVGNIVFSTDDGIDLRSAPPTTPSVPPTEVVTPTPSPSVPPTEVVTPTPSPSVPPTEVVTPTPSPSVPPTEVVTPTPSPSVPPTEVVTPTPSPSVPPTEVVTPTPSPSVPPTEVVTPTPTPSVPSTEVVTPTPSPSVPPTEVVTPTPTPSVPPTRVVNRTPRPSVPPTRVVTRTPSPSVPPTRVVTPTPSPSVPPTRVVTPTPSPSVPPTRVVTPTPSPSVPPTRVVTPTPSPSVPPTRVVTPTPIDPTERQEPERQPPTLDPKDFQGPEFRSLHNPVVAAVDRILTLDSSIISQLPPGYPPPTVPSSEFSPTVNPTSNLVLGYAPSPDQLFGGNDIQKTVSGIEEMRNQEFGQYLGIKGNLPEEKVLISTSQQTLKKIAQQTGKRSGIIYIVSRADQLELILVPPVGQPIHYSVPEANRAALFPTIQEFRKEITNPAKRDTTTYLAAAQQLYKWAIAPLEKDLQNLGIQTLLLSVDPGLRSLPFAALHDGKRFLIEKYSFSLIPSFSLTNTDYKAVKDATVLAMGRSEFVDQQPLPNVPIELQAISAQGNASFFLNSTFTIDNLNSEHAKGGFRIVHLATHAEFKAGKASNSYIQLWNSKLQLDRMESLNWRNPQVDLLVLSACRTALGDRDAELGFGGLAVKSGAKSALGSLWYVDDGGTLALMSEFYHQLRGATTKAEALQLAQQAIMSGKVRLENGQLVTTGSQLNLPPNLQQANQNFSHPYYWSSFTIIGSPW